MHFNSVPFRAIVIESLFSGRCSRNFTRRDSRCSTEHRDRESSRTSHSESEVNSIPRRARAWHLPRCRLRRRGENKSNTQTDAVLGSPEYMSPEQCKGGVSIDQKADLYSLGVMMYRMLSGRLPFNAEGVGALMAMHIYEKPPDHRGRLRRIRRRI